MGEGNGEKRGDKMMGIQVFSLFDLLCEAFISRKNHHHPLLFSLHSNLFFWNEEELAYQMIDYVVH